MFNADPKLMHRLAATLGRVMILDPLPAAARLAADLLKEIGAGQVVTLQGTGRALELAGKFSPQLVVTEYWASDFDGPGFVRALRRASGEARYAPVLMITAEATVESIKAARDSGVHEFLRKPYTAGDLFKRLKNMQLEPRPWIEAQMYVGPDRRRFNSAEFEGDLKRRADSARSDVASEQPAAATA